MAKPIALSARPRTIFGKHVQQLRRQGITPIVVYGHKSDPIALETDTKELVHVLSAAGGTHLVAIAIDGESEPRMTLAKAVQRHVTRLTPLHADFLQVVMDEPITQAVPIHIEGEPESIRLHQATLSQDMQAVTVKALPDKLPPFITIDVSGLALGDILHVSDLPVTRDYEILEDPAALVVRLAPTVEAEEEEVAAEELEAAEVPAEEKAASDTED
jgi:large subunit ribosomal protein L25